MHSTPCVGDTVITTFLWSCFSFKSLGKKYLFNNQIWTLFFVLLPKKLKINSIKNPIKLQEI